MKSTRTAPTMTTTIKLPPGGEYCLDHPLTVDEFLELVDEDTNAELVNGVIFVPPAPTVEHEEYFGFLHSALRIYAEALDLGVVYGSRTAIRIDRHTAREPDILFVRKSRRHLVSKKDVVGPPDLIVEFVSPSDRPSDLARKQAQYEVFGVPELWLINLREKRATVLRLNQEGQYDVYYHGGHGALEPLAVPGFVVQAQWFWGEAEMPNLLSYVNSLVKKAKRRKVKKGTRNA